MSAGLALFHKLLVEEESFNTLSSCGLTVDVFLKEEKKVYAYIERHLRRYDRLPSVETVERETKVDLGDVPEEALLYWIDTVEKRRQGSLLLDAAKKVKEEVVDGDVEKAKDVVISLLTDLDANRADASVVDIREVSGQVIVAHDERRMRSELTGVPFGIPYLDEISDGAQPADTIAFVGGPGVGKCLPYGSLVPVADGTLCPIERVGKKEVLNWFRKSGVYCYIEPRKVFREEMKECVRVALDNGVVFEASVDHPFFEGETCGEVAAGRLSVGNYLAVPNMVPEPEKPTPMKKSRVIINAMMLAEGGITTGSSTWTNNDNFIVKMMGEALSNEKLCLCQRDSCRPGSYFVVDEIGESGVTVRNRLFRCGIRHRVKSVNKAIDDCIFKLPNDQLALWIGVFYSCDGAKGRVIDVTLGSKRLVLQLKYLFLRFGIYGKVVRRNVLCNGKRHKAWRLTVAGETRKKFWDAIPIFSTTKMKESWRPGCSSVPAFKWLRSFVKKKIKQGYWIEQTRESRFQPSKLFCRGGRDVIVRAALRLAAKRYLFEKDILWLESVEWARVTKIEKVGVKKCVDIVMPHSPWFICDQVITHNSYLLFRMALSAWEAGYTPAVVPLEMSVFQTGRRILALRSRLSAKMIRLGQLSTLARDRLGSVVDELREIDDRPFHLLHGSLRSTADDLALKCQELKPDILYVDGAYLLKTKSFTHSLWERIAGAAESLKMVAKDFDIPIVSTYQFNRRGRSRKGGGDLGDIGGSAAIEQLASIVCAMFDEEGDVSRGRNWSAQEIKLLRILKGREGERGLVRLVYDMARARIEEESFSED